jgi:RNA ligase
MKYRFPVIRSIDDIENHRDSGLIHEAFKCGRRDNGTMVYDYAYMDNHVFPPIDATPFASVARELRGITFDARTGELLSRPYQKFFNAGEREEVLAQHIPFGEPHHVLDKLDGSMIHAFIAPSGDLAFATRWGVTSISQQALSWYSGIDSAEAGRNSIKRIAESGFTAIFEWTSPQNVVVVRHERAVLTLTGIRHRESGAYVPYDQLHDHAAAIGVPLVRASGTVEQWENFVERAVAETEGEGYVIRFADGHMLKIKNAIYARVHKFKANLAREKDAAEIVISGALDDMLPHLTAAERETLEAYRDRLFARLNEHAAGLDARVARARSGIATNDARERQKIFWMTYAAPLGAPLSGYATEIWIGRRAALEAISSGLLKNTSTNAKFDAIVTALDLPRLTFGFDGDQ